jgi:hypothetical protein
MDRRRFVAAGAGIVAVTATGAVAGVLGVTSKGGGERVTMSGWISPARRGPGHYFVLGPDAGVSDPAATQVDHWPQHLTLVLPSDATKLRAGRVTLQGRLYRGKVVDLPTGHVATSVLTEATLV